MVVEAFLQALQNLLDLWIVLSVFVAVVVSLVLGILPGLSGMIGMALFLPFVFFLPPEQSLPVMTAMGAVSFTSGSITAILLNIPGTDPNAATTIDGFPMTQKGEAGRALGAGLMSSGAGGIVTVFIALAMVPLVVPFIMAIRSADMVFVILLGISFIAVLGSGSMLRGLISGGIGLMISFVGYHVITGVTRFTFGISDLFDGVHLVPLLLGLFALPEALNLAARGGGTISRTEVVIKGLQEVREGAKDVFRHWGLWLRCSVIGFIVGLIPGIGGTAATFIAYGQAKQTAKNPERFGTGCVEGVIAPESANNASASGALLTTLALGIPGSAAMAVLLGAFEMAGLVPGPEMMSKHLDLSLTLLMVIVLANLLAVLICLLSAPYLARIAMIPGHILFPLILTIVFVGAFVYHERFFDVTVLIVFSIVGLVLSKFRYNRPAFLLGFILGNLFEKYFFLSLGLSGPLFFVRPISLILIAITIVAIAYNPVKSLIRSKRGLNKA